MKGGVSDLNPKNSDKLLSIIIPVYNTEKYIQKCLTSIFKKLPEHTEVIIVNDGSPDNAEYIIKKFQKRYTDSLIYCKKPNGGLSDAKNYGLSKAKGKYITFVDSDDYIDPNMHKEMLDLALEKDADIVYCDVEQVFEDGHKIYSHCTNISRKTDYFRLIDTPLMAASWNKLIKKELYTNIQFPVGLNNEDVAVAPILFAKAKKIYKIDKPFYKYYQRSGSIQNSGFNEKRFVIFDTAKICFQEAKNLSEELQLQIKGSLYTHQILALLIYPISNLSKEEQKHLIPIFCQKINAFGDDFYKNRYVIEYVKNLKRTHLLKLLKKADTAKIIRWLAYYKLFDAFRNKCTFIKTTIQNFIKKIFVHIISIVKKIISIPKILLRKTRTFFRIIKTKIKNRED